MVGIGSGVGFRRGFLRLLCFIGRRLCVVIIATVGIGHGGKCGHAKADGKQNRYSSGRFLLVHFIVCVLLFVVCGFHGRHVGSAAAQERDQFLTGHAHGANKAHDLKVFVLRALAFQLFELV